MTERSDLRSTRVPLNNGSGRMPALGFGTLIPEAAVTMTATKDALEAGFRHFDCAERYRNEPEVGVALRAGLAAGEIAREDLFAGRRPRIYPASQIMVATPDCVTYPLPRSSFATATRRSGSNPNFRWSSLSGADAPKVVIPITRPAEPT